MPATRSVSDSQQMDARIGLILCQNKRKQQVTSHTTSKDAHVGPVPVPTQLHNLIARITTLESRQHEINDTNERQMNYIERLEVELCAERHKNDVLEYNLEKMKEAIGVTNAELVGRLESEDRAHKIARAGWMQCVNGLEHTL